MEKSLQKIQNFYENLGYSGNNLRSALLKDKDYRQILEERKQKLTKKINITKSESKKYVLSIDLDYLILEKIKLLEKKSLKKDDKIFVKFIRSQLEHEWRKPLLRTLNSLLSKYK